MDGEIDREEYVRIRNQNQREIANGQSRTSETEQLALELAMCVEAVDKITHLWDISGEEDRQGLVRNLFEYLVYDLDTQRITDFRLKPWADRFMILRAALYEDEGGTGSGGSTPSGENGMSEGQAAIASDEAAYEEVAPMGHLPVSAFITRNPRICWPSLPNSSTLSAALIVTHWSAQSFCWTSTIRQISIS